MAGSLSCGGGEGSPAVRLLYKINANDYDSHSDSVSYTLSGAAGESLPPIGGGEPRGTQVYENGSERR